MPTTKPNAEAARISAINFDNAQKIRSLAEDLEVQAEENLSGGWSTNSNKLLLDTAAALRSLARKIEKTIP
jgi:hypothetical protein